MWFSSLSNNALRIGTFSANKTNTALFVIMPACHMWFVVFPLQDRSFGALSPTLKWTSRWVRCSRCPPAALWWRWMATLTRLEAIASVSASWVTSIAQMPVREPGMWTTTALWMSWMLDCSNNVDLLYELVWPACEYRGNIRTLGEYHHSVLMLFHHFFL